LHGHFFRRCCNTHKEVVHDVIGVEEATQRLDAITQQKQKYNKWLLVLIYGLASATVGPFAFQARLIDLPLSFVLGSILGTLQLIIAPKSDLYSNVFEISATVLTSFLARAFGSIQYNGEPLFCFSALAQSAIALILPGYVALCGSLELQSKSMVAGSVRMVYAIIVSTPYPFSCSALGAFAAGTLGNLYLRVGHGVAAAALLPAIFVQVPSGLAAGGSLLAGISSANQITNSSVYANGTLKSNTTDYSGSGSGGLSSAVLTVGYSMIQVAIGITVGLFLSALIVYPFGRRSGLFSF
jgi:uncharacterized membrane protein YjjB (DUF3815 family)